MTDKMGKLDGAGAARICPRMRLIFHIGAGKTGTSSIQHTLAKNGDQLARHGFRYLGLMFESAPVMRYPWQKASASEIFHELSPDDTEKQLLVVLRETIKLAQTEGVHTLIWSNESFFDRSQKVGSALQILQSEGVDVQLIAYVRRHDAWIRSAYIQWGIKHKTYTGPILPFRQWVEKRYPKFYPPLSSLIEAFPERVKVRNLDAVRDAVVDFLDICGLGSANISTTRSNETPSGTEILMRAVFNNRINGKALPVIFDRTLGKDVGFDESTADYLEHLLPSAADISEIAAACVEDRNSLNELLASQGQPPIQESPLPTKNIDVDTGALLKGLCEMVVNQALRVQRLEKRIEELGAESTKK